MSMGAQMLHIYITPPDGGTSGPRKTGSEAIPSLRCRFNYYRFAFTYLIPMRFQAYNTGGKSLLAPTARPDWALEACRPQTKVTYVIAHRYHSAFPAA